MIGLVRGTIRLIALSSCLGPSVVLAAAPPEPAEEPRESASLPASSEESPAEDAAPSAPEGSPSAATCANWHETAQIARFDGRFLEARDALRACAAESCPSFVRGDCGRWLEEVERQIPTVVFEALDEHGLLTEVEVRQDGRLITSHLDGEPVQVQAGSSEFVFTGRSGEEAVVRVFLRPGEVNRVVSVDLRRHPGPAPAPAPPAAEATPGTTETLDTRPLPPIVYWTGATALVSAAAGVTFGAIAKVKEADAANSCAPDCSDAVVSNITSHALVADIAFGVALAAGATTVILIVTRPTVKVPQTRVAYAADARPRWQPVAAATPHAGWLGVRGSFR